MSVAVKRKRISKKNKAAWRKTDIKDVEQYLDEQRQEERIGASLFTEKKDEDLFTVDVTPLKPKRGLTERQKRKLNAKKPLRSLEALKNTSKVQDPITKRNHVKQKKQGRFLEEEVRNPTKPLHFQANKDRERYYEHLEKRLNKKDTHLKTARDIWAEKDFRDEIPGLKDEKGWISRDLSLYVSKNVGKPVVKVHDSIRHRTTKAKNFEAPHPGMSYNPSLQDHQSLIGKVVEREEKIIKVEKHLKRVTTDMFSKVTPEERDRQKLEEMRAGLDDQEEEPRQEQPVKRTAEKKSKTTTPTVRKISKTESVENGGEGNESDGNGPYKTVNPPVENKKKSRQARNRELKQKALHKKQQDKKALSKQTADLNRIKSLKTEVLVEAAALNVLKKHRKKVALKKKFEPKRLGRLKFVEPDADVNMPDDIAGNLRNVKTESSLLVDRFKNFQKRNLLPTSVATGKQKARKIKRFPRTSHKEPGVSFHMLREQRKATNKGEEETVV